jgi:dihydrofolate synthase/folylpolyglutamate synthase
MASPEQRQTTIQSLKLGLSKASWPGRFEIFEDPKMILDGAHNPHGAKALRASLLEKFGQVNFVFLLTCFENKDAEELLHALLGPGDTIFAFAPESERKMHRPEYLLGIAQAAGAHGYVVANCTEAVHRSQEILANNNAYAPYLIAAGSFATVREASRYINSQRLGKIESHQG